jgi:hypothetical protein
MAGNGLFGERALRRDTELGRVLAAVEVPDCRCKPERNCLEGLENYPADCPGEHACKHCPLAPCKHVAAIDPRRFPLTLSEWRELLLAHDPAGYGEPPAPAEPRVAVTREARVAVLADRAWAGLGFWHAADLIHMEGVLDHLATEAESGKKQGDIFATWHDDDEDEPAGLDFNLERRPDPGDRMALRSLEFDRAAARATAANQAERER